MGIHIIVKDKDYNRHPDWDHLRQAGDREFPNLIDWGNTVTEDESFRPTDVPELRRRIDASHLSNKARYHHLLDLLQDEKWWLYFSY